MKRTLLDKVVGFFSPETELKRIKSRGKAELLMRSYDAAQTFNTDDWTSATKGSANSEISAALDSLRNKGSDAVRNNTYGTRAVMAIANNTVGAGIVPHIKGQSPEQVKLLNDAWKEWGETTLCDSDRKNNFYAMQTLAMRAIPERGEIVALKELAKEGHKIKLLESDFIVNSQNKGQYRDGIKLDGAGKIVGYSIYNSHPGDAGADLKFRDVPVEQLCHVYRQDRPGQLRGVSWFAPVIRQLEDLNQYQQATLITRKIGACYSAFVKTDGSDGNMSSSDLIAKREAESMLSPGAIRYLSQGEDIVLATPPKVDGYTEFCNQLLRSIASGLGISYESLTSDYSQVNYSSGRMGHLEFRKNIEQWRWSMLIPQFCDPCFQHFLQWCYFVKKINIDGVSVDWIPPSYSMLDPTKEIAAMTDGMRSGLISYQRAVRELGYQPEDILQEISENNAQLDALKIIIDSDPRKTTKAGLLQMDPSQQNSNNGGFSGQQNDEKTPSDGSSSDAD